jgi:hypothetical protein
MLNPMLERKTVKKKNLFPRSRSRNPDLLGKALSR